MKIEGGATIWARQTIDSEIFYNKPDKWFKIWFYLVAKANHTDNKRFKEGSCFLKYDWIMNATGANKNEVDHCIRWLKSATMIATQKATRGFIVNVLKYPDFQNLQNYKSDGNGETKAKQKRNKSDTINKNVKNGKNDKNKPNTCVAGNSSATREVFDYWISKLGHTKAKFTRDRKGKISARLKEGFSIDELKRAIDGCVASSYHMGDNDDGKVYDNINLIFRNAEKIESFWGYLKQKEQNYDKLTTRYSNR
ncbi:MAG TPA: hypothetical protein ENH85_14350 [Candidatus Scalindua sp.]|nr:hypothetical protein [Candidatus Scalindua sp.]